jgi:hypothetical protein
MDVLRSTFAKVAQQTDDRIIPATRFVTFWAQAITQVQVNYRD